MKNIQNVVILFIALVLTSCVSVVQIFDQWEGEKFNESTNQKILVVNKTTDKFAKERFEKDLADRFRKSGIDAVESHIAFPDITPKERSEEEIDAVIAKIKDAGFTSVVISGIKDKIENSETNRVGGYDKEMNTGAGNGISIYNYSYHYYGFGSFYGSVYNSNVGSIYIEPETTTNSYNIYVLEAVTYNLSLKKEEQVVGVLTVRITDPTSYDEVATKYAKMIVKHFKAIL